jgi:hypothetical protein
MPIKIFGLNLIKHYFSMNIDSQLFLSCLSLLLLSCSEFGQNELPECGCKSVSIANIPDKEISNVPIEVQTSGVLFYKDKDLEDRFVPEEKFNNRFWIFRGTDDCYNCQHKFIVCNESVLKGQFDHLRAENNSDSIPVTFTGSLKLMCSDELIVIPADYYYAEIVLASIYLK